MAATRTDKKILEQLIIRPPLRERPLKRLPILHDMKRAKTFVIVALILGTTALVALFLLSRAFGEMGADIAAIIGLLSLSCGTWALKYL